MAPLFLEKAAFLKKAPHGIIHQSVFQMSESRFRGREDIYMQG
jgi:hypothetical protein